jgi:hypothetical protein
MRDSRKKMTEKDLSNDPLIAFFWELKKVEDNQRSLVKQKH